MPANDVPYARGPNSAAGRRGRRRSAYEAPRAAADGGTRLGGAESKRRRRPRLPAPPSRVTLLARRRCLCSLLRSESGVRSLLSERGERTSARGDRYHQTHRARQGVRLHRPRRRVGGRVLPPRAPGAARAVRRAARRGPGGVPDAEGREGAAGVRRKAPLTGRGDGNGEGEEGQEEDEHEEGEAGAGGARRRQGQEGRAEYGERGRRGGEQAHRDPRGGESAAARGGLRAAGPARRTSGTGPRAGRGTGGARAVERAS